MQRTIAPTIQHNQVIQRFTPDDIRYMFMNKMGFRHHDSNLEARLENLRGTSGGDAIPMNAAAGDPGKTMAIMRGQVSQEEAEAFTAKVLKFIRQSLNRTVLINLGVTTPREVITNAASRSTFLFVNAMQGTDVPKDIENKDYVGLGKAGKQKIDAQQIVALMSFDDIGREFMELIHDGTLDQPISSKPQGEELTDDIALFFLESAKDQIFKRRTGGERFMQGE